MTALRSNLRLFAEIGYHAATNPVIADAAEKLLLSLNRRLGHTSEAAE